MPAKGKEEDSASELDTDPASLSLILLPTSVKPTLLLYFMKNLLDDGSVLSIGLMFAVVYSGELVTRCCIDPVCFKSFLRLESDLRM